jgi:putative ABC transport system permease protein
MPTVLVDDLAKDLAYAARILRKTPVFAITAAVTIALGIGVSTAIFSVANAVLLRPLPYKNPDRLVLADPFLSNADFFDLRNGTGAVFEEMAAVTEADNAIGRNVAVIDQLLAAKAFPDQSALGKRLCAYIPSPAWLEVVGVVAHQRLGSLAEPGREQIYLTDGFWGIGISRHWAFRTAGDPAKYAAAVRAEVARFAPGRLAVTEIETMDTTVDRAQAATRFHLLLIGVFAAVAALLAGVGLYCVLSSVVRQRTAEIGVRMAFGAAPAGIFKLVVGHGLLLSAAGVALGLAAAFGLTRVMTSMLVGIKATDPATFAAMTLLFSLIAAVASWAPARRAAGLDPTPVLREE